MLVSYLEIVDFSTSCCQSRTDFDENVSEFDEIAGIIIFQKVVFASFREKTLFCKKCFVINVNGKGHYSLSLRSDSLFRAREVVNYVRLEAKLPGCKTKTARNRRKAGASRARGISGWSTQLLIDDSIFRGRCLILSDLSECQKNAIIRIKFQSVLMF